jgi:hypothetical protein
MRIIRFKKLPRVGRLPVYFPTCSNPTPGNRDPTGGKQSNVAKVRDFASVKILSYRPLLAEFVSQYKYKKVEKSLFYNRKYP